MLDALNIGPINANLGALSVTGLKLTYDRPSDTWTGSGKVCLLTGVCLDMTPPNGEVKIVNGDLNYAGATLDFPTPGVPLFAGVNLTNIGFGLGLDPTRSRPTPGSACLTSSSSTGRSSPASRPPTIRSSCVADEVGSDFPANLYGVPLHEPTIGASADVGVNLPVVGNVTLGHGYLLYEVPDYIALGGAVDYKFLKRDRHRRLDRRGGELLRRNPEPARRGARLPAGHRQAVRRRRRQHLARSELGGRSRRLRRRGGTARRRRDPVEASVRSDRVAV